MTIMRVVNLPKVEKYFDGLLEITEDKVWTEGMQDGINEELDDIIERAPEWRGDLIDSIEGPVELVPGGAIAEVGPRVDYAPFVEYETVRHFVPAKFIGEWAQDHGFGYTGLIVSGRALPFMRRNESETLLAAAERMADTVVASMERYLKGNI